MVVYACKKCGELKYLTPHAFWNTDDFDARCEKCDTINTITVEEGELKKQGFHDGRLIDILKYFEQFISNMRKPLWKKVDTFTPSNHLILITSGDWTYHQKS